MVLVSFHKHNQRLNTEYGSTGLPVTRRSVSICAKNGTGLVPVPSADLPEGWGIETFPCSRLSPLDCFQEGAYDCGLLCRIIYTYHLLSYRFCI